MKSRTPWKVKLKRASSPHIEEAPSRWVGGQLGRKMLIPSALEMDAWIRQIPDKETRTVVQMREHFAKKYGADITCPMTSGIFLRIIAENAEEERNEGKTDVTPYWRVVLENGKMPPKIQAVHDREHGHVIA